jgi:glycosyltransferase involved in cell wall biosynthesis
MRALVISNLFPNRAEPGRGLFNQQQFEALPAEWELEVIAPLPWMARVPGAAWPEDWRRIAAVPARETIGRITVHHPRYLVVPKIGRRLSGHSLSWSLHPLVRRLHAASRFDVILATWAYPDVFAAVLAGRALGLPVVAKVHGSDVHVASRISWRRRAIRWALTRCAGVVAVSSSLKAELAGFGVPGERIHVVPNGIDVERFHPLDRREARARLSLPLEGRRIVFVGNLAPVKGLPVLLEAAAAVSGDVSFSLVGDGPQRAELAALIKRLGLSGRATLVGRVPHQAIPLWMSAGDLFCLPSVSEGCPNVVVEALACGTPVVASRVGGIPELVRETTSGFLVNPGRPDELAAAIERALAGGWDPAAIRRTVEDRGWAESARRIGALLQSAARAAALGPAAAGPAS